MNKEYRIYKNFIIKEDILYELEDNMNWIDVTPITTGQNNKKPSMVEIRNLASNLFSVPGYMMSLSIPGLFKNEITFIDSLQSTIYYEEFNLEGKLIDNQYEVKIRRISGMDNLPDPDPNNVNVNVLIGNASIMFSLVFYYNS